jgi:hypothetical protein
MTRDDKINALKMWENSYNILAEITSDLEKLFGDITESKLGDAHWELFMTMTEMTAQNITEDFETDLDNISEWLNWFCWENKMGKGGLAAGSFIAMSTVDTIEDLLNLIEGHGKYAS